jgi:hypothetical protein
MPRTSPTIVAPLPNDPRVFALAKASGLTTRESFAAAAEVWAWVSVMSVDDIVVNTAPDSLDAVVDIAGFGQAMLGAGLVGTVDGGLVLPAELRHPQRDESAGGDARGSRSNSAERQKRYRDRKRLSVPAPKRASAAAAVDAPGPSVNMPRRLGEVEGYPVMLLFSRQGVPFYKLAGASPKEWTGTVTDPSSPSYADALAAIHAAMKREGGKGLGGGNTFRPSMQDMVTAAERYRDARASAAVDAARRDEANTALLEASAEGDDEADLGSVERNGSVTGDARYVTPVTGDATGDVWRYAPEQSTASDAKTSGDSQRYGERYASSPSSSNSLSVSGNEDKYNTTTTSSGTTAERDPEDRILERFCPREDAATVEKRRKRQQLVERFAAALGDAPDAIDRQWRTEPDVLRTRLESAGIDPNTGLPFNADAPGKPDEARDDIGVTTEPIDQGKPAAGSVDVRGEFESGCAVLEQRHGLERQGIPSAAVHSLPAEGDFEQQRVNVVNGIAAGA